ncbi:MAG: bifunctional riboflavin kinase/FAD synthetase [Pirellulales bacterium]|nr:bifunctional riboflavin kinase/FAD synthetase [Pirellulales bacterium]
MQLIRQPDDLPEALRGGAVAIGNFDGVHQGHARLIETLRAEADRVGGPAVAFTFDPHPAQILRPDAAPPLLTGTQRKADLLAQLGVDAVVAYPTDRAFLDLDADTFFQRLVRDRLDARAMVEGSNFLFGHNRSGDLTTLGRLCDQAGIALRVVDPISVDGLIVSSSRVRELLAQGRLEQANRLLTAPYRIAGTVGEGRHRGATLGYPTANIERIGTLLPSEGIYAGRAWIEQTPHAAAVSLGPNRTFDEEEIKVEAFILDFSGSLYGKPIKVDFLARLRDIKRFDSVEALVAQIDHDVAAVRQIVAATPDIPARSPQP